MSRLFFKTNAPELKAALDKVLEQEQAMHDEAEAFAAEFGGEAVIAGGMNGLHCLGLKFKPARDPRLWTKPEPKTGYIQRPRTKLPSGGIDRKAAAEALRELNARWKAHQPKLRADITDVYEAAGFNVGNLWLSGGQMFEWEGYLYFAATTKPGPLLVEILGSEFALAAKLERTARKAGAA